MSASDNVLTAVVSTVLSGGLVGAVVQIFNARNTRRQIQIQEDKAPAEMQTVLLGGAASAVQLLTSSLEWAEEELKGLREDQINDKRKIRELQQNIAKKDERIAEMGTELRNLRGQLAGIQSDLDHALGQIQELQREKGNDNGTAIL